MQSLNNAASTASRAIWGDSTNKTTDSATEPVSGQTGNTAQGEPYDAGNIEESSTQHQTQSAKTIDPSGTNDSSRAGELSSTGPSSSGLPMREQANVPDNNGSSGPIPTENNTDKGGVMSNAGTSNAPGNTYDNSSGGPTSSVDAGTLTRGQNNQNSTSTGGPTSSVDAGSGSSGQNNQNSTSTGGPTSSVDAGSGSSGQNNQNSNSTGGPTSSVDGDPANSAQNTQKQSGTVDPLNDGSAGVEGDASKNPNADAKHESTGDAGKPASGGGMPGVPGSEGLQNESKGEGTGEKWIKTSGMKADGGDFDAAQAGAGKEADRLLEEKGIHHEPGAAGPPADDKEDEAAADSSGKKPSLAQKLKDKLHKK